MPPYSKSTVGLADGAMPQAAGGEGGHGAAKPHPVIHRLWPGLPLEALW